MTLAYVIGVLVGLTTMYQKVYFREHSQQVKKHAKTMYQKVVFNYGMLHNSLHTFWNN